MSGRIDWARSDEGRIRLASGWRDACQGPARRVRRQQDQPTTSRPRPKTAEAHRLEQAASREIDWKRWGPYLAERQWGTVREDYSDHGAAWEYFTHDHARSRAYRWGEDGRLGICDRQGRLCFALALWNGRDAMLKERLFGLTGAEGNHGEDVKECYFYLDSTPTHSYMKALYKTRRRRFPTSRSAWRIGGAAGTMNALGGTGLWDDTDGYDRLTGVVREIHLGHAAFADPAFDGVAIREGFVQA